MFSALLYLCLAPFSLGASEFPVLAEIGGGGPHSRLALRGTHLYVATFGGILVVDVSDPDMPLELVTRDTTGAALDLAMLGGHLLVADSDRLLVFDISNPSSPTQVAAWAPKTTSPVSMNLLRVVGTTVYIADLETLRIMDLAEPSMPEQVSAYAVGSVIFSLDLANDRAYLTANSQLQIVDVSNRFAPVLVSSTPLGFFGLGIQMNDETAYIGDLGRGLLRVWDTSQPTPVEQGQLTLSGQPLWKFFLDGNNLYMPMNAGGLAIVEVSNPAQPTLLGQLGTSDTTREVLVNGNTAYLADYTAGTRVLDVTDPSEPVERASLGQGNVAERFYLDGDRGYRVDYGPMGTNLMRVVDLSDRTNPLTLGSYATSDIWSLAPDGDFVFVAEDDEGLQVISVANGSQPQNVASLVGVYRGLDRNEDRVYAVGADALTIIDVSTPTNPQPLGQLKLSTPRGVQVVGTRVYVADRTRGLVIVDASDPGRPTLVSSLATQVAGADLVRVFGDLAFIPYQGLEVIDVSDPTMPVTSAFYNGTFIDVIYEQERLYAAQGVDNLNMYEMGAELTLVACIETPGNARLLNYETGRIYLSDNVGGRHLIYGDVLRYSRLLSKWGTISVLDLVVQINGQTGVAN